MTGDFLPISDRNLILTGYIGPDQPLLGKDIAARMRMPFVNIEMEIAGRAHLPIDQIRSSFGESRLKAVEIEIVGETILRRATVIHISGRTLLNGDNLTRLLTTGPVICLVVELGEMLRRLHVSMGARYHDPQERALALGELKREWAIRGKDGIHEIDATDMANEEIITGVITLWRELAMMRE